MFRKPTKKSAVRKRTDGWEDKEDAGNAAESPTIAPRKDAAPVKPPIEDDDVDTPVSKPPALLSFDNDEGGDTALLTAHCITCALLL